MRQKAIRFCIGIGIAALGILLVGGSQAIGQGIRDGLLVSGQVLIPSLFPFMVLSGFIAITDWGRVLSYPLRPITQRIYKLPQDLGVVMAISLVGGYPIGAKTISTLLKEGRINKATAQRMLCFCVNAGPAFVVSAVGAGMFADRRIGIILFICQVISTLIVGAVVSYSSNIPQVARPEFANRKNSEAFVEAVSGASSSMIVMCAFAVLFSGIAAMLADLEGVSRVILSGFLEVAAGNIAAAQIGGEMAVVLASMFISFSGLSVIFQVMFFFKGQEISFWPFFISRIAHGVISSILTLIIYRRIYAHTPAWMPTSAPIMYADDRTLILSICLIIMSTMLVLSVKKYK